MKRIIPLIIVAGVALTALVASSNSEPAGKQLFKDNKCTSCHTIALQGLDRSGAPPPGKAPPDLSHVGSVRAPDWIQRWLKKQEMLNGKKHLKTFSGSDDDAKTLGEWLGSLK